MLCIKKHLKKVLSKVNRALCFKIWETLTYTPGLRLPSQLELSEEEIEIIKNLSWRDLDWDTIGDDGKSVIWLELKLPVELDIKDGVVVDIQLINKSLYQIHIQLAEEIRGIGLGTKIYRSLIEWAGHLYSGRRRRHNPIITKVWDKLKREPGLECASNDLGDICVSKLNPNKDELIKYFKNI